MRIHRFAQAFRQAETSELFSVWHLLNLREDELQQQCNKSKTNGRNIDRNEFADDVIQNNQRVKDQVLYSQT